MLVKAIENKFKLFNGMPTFSMQITRKKWVEENWNSKMFKCRNSRKSLVSLNQRVGDGNLHLGRKGRNTYLTKIEKDEERLGTI